MKPETFFFATVVLFSFAVFLQSVEMLQMKRTWSESTGIWKWSFLKKEHPSRFAQSFLEPLLSERGYYRVHVINLFCCALLFVFGISFILDWSIIKLLPYFLFLLAAAVPVWTTWLTSVRWRGIFYGGADSLTMIIGLSVFLGILLKDDSSLFNLPLAWIAVQTTFSYWVAGFHKIKNPAWRNGSILSAVVSAPRYDRVPHWFKNAVSSKWASLAMAWFIMVFQLSVLLVWIAPAEQKTLVFGVFVVLGMAFHFLNFWVFGLNRFFWIWIASYPALLAWGSKFHCF